MKKSLIVIIFIFTILTVGCSKEYVPSGPANIESLTETIYNTVRAKADGEEAISLLTYDDKEVRLFIKKDVITKYGLLKDSAKLFENIYKHDGVNNIKLTWEANFVDSYGNSEYNTVMIVNMSKQVADKINWDNFDQDNLEKLADEFKVHEQIK